MEPHDGLGPALSAVVGQRVGVNALEREVESERDPGDWGPLRVLLEVSHRPARGLESRRLTATPYHAGSRTPPRSAESPRSA
jgi:hypothetical protein